MHFSWLSCFAIQEKRNPLKMDYTRETVSRLVSLIVVLSSIQRGSIIVSARFNLISYKNKAWNGVSFKNLTGLTMKLCLEHCLANCLCISFQVCDNRLCLLISTTKESGQLKDRQGCVGYKFMGEHDTKVSGDQCRSSICSTAINCCMKSNPCKNGGKCIPTISGNTTRRFTCECNVRSTGNRCQRCANGYTGRNCQQQIRSCRDYKGHDSGFYKIFGYNSDLFSVYCDLNETTSMAWTLVQSYKRGIAHLVKSFVLDQPEAQDKPNKNHYRLTKSRMHSIQQHSRAWRITCDFKKDTGVNYNDYVQASIDKVDILTFNGQGCVYVDHIAVRGQHRRNCTAYMLQSHNDTYYEDLVPLHFDPYGAERYGCDFTPNESKNCHGKGEDNFGFYKCVNTDHKCSASGSSTTQLWFGGK